MPHHGGAQQDGNRGSEGQCGRRGGQTSYEGMFTHHVGAGVQVKALASVLRTRDLTAESCGFCCCYYLDIIHHFKVYNPGAFKYPQSFETISTV